ncbi:MAG TPA: ribosomal-processing cysteine protease Prp [Ruminococcus sp.]|nr:ribosomal-processing cysteine protease Prp [Ruminococcus sp.]
MIRAEFFESKGCLVGFSFSGHSGYAESGSDIVCAAVSSAVQLTANMLEEFGHSPELKVGGNVIECRVRPDDNASQMIKVLREHFESILEEFPKTIKITNSEV